MRTRVGPGRALPTAVPASCSKFRTRAKGAAMATRARGARPAQGLQPCAQPTGCTRPRARPERAGAQEPKGRRARRACAKRERALHRHARCCARVGQMYARCAPPAAARHATKRRRTPCETSKVEESVCRQTTISMGGLPPLRGCHYRRGAASAQFRPTGQQGGLPPLITKAAGGIPPSPTKGSHGGRVNPIITQAECRQHATASHQAECRQQTTASSQAECRQ